MGNRIREGAIILIGSTVLAWVVIVALFKAVGHWCCWL